MLVLVVASGSRGGPPISGSQTICLLGRKFGNPSTLILLTGSCRPFLVLSSEGFMASLDSVSRLLAACWQQEIF